MQSVWQVQEAKNRFSELIELTLLYGPQTVTRHGRAVVQMVPINEPRAGELGPAPEQTADDRFTQHLLSVPSPGLAIELPRRRNRKVAPL